MLSAVLSLCVPKSRFASLLRSLLGCAAALLLLPLGVMGQTSFSGVVVITSNTAVPSGSYTLTSLTVQNGAVLTIGGGSTVTVTGAVVVTGSSSVVLQAINTTAQVNGAWAGQGVTLNAGSIQVDAGSSINADGQGYVGNAGPGGAPGGSSAGGSYGGLGGVGAGTPATSVLYGSTTAPVDLGSGGSSRCCSAVPGAGGGALTLNVSGTLSNNGIISANGGNSSNSNPAGGGSGGSVYVTASVLTGTGVFTANGGAGGEAGGGGGRVAVYYNGTTSSFTGFATSTASGGLCPNTCSNGTSSVGGTGTAGFYDTSASNTNLAVYQDQAIPAGSVVKYNSITVAAGSVLTIGGGSTVTVANGLTVNGTVVAQSMNTTAQVNGAWVGVGVTLNAASVTVNTGGSINADGQGYVVGAGPGGAPGSSSAGGSYGGVGGVGDGVTAAATYGSTTAPTDLGSGGNVRCCSAVAGAGGGAITLNVSGTLTNNGIISANGGNTSNATPAGGGSGGSIYVTTAVLVGSGVFEANGGLGGEAGGGGGRVAVYYNGTGSNFSGFATSTASGGTCPNTCNSSGVGANGTSGFFDTSATNNNLSVYQNFVIPASTTVSYNSITSQTGALITIGGGSTVNVSQALTVSGTVVAQSINNTAQVNGAWAGVGVTLNAGSVTINTTGSINADVQGYLAGVGPGAGPGGWSAGGSYGGLGGVGDGVAAVATYGSPTAPTDLGSGGGSRCCSAVPGAGGGELNLTVSGTLTNNGILSANGGNTSNSNPAGGGSGGALLIHTGTLAGSGSIAANGGNGGEAGGGGGRIALYYNTNTGFNLTQVTANGGTCPNTCNSAGIGGAGTVYSLASGSSLTVSDNTVLPANANLTYTSVTINNGAALTLGSGTTLAAGSISVSAASTFTVGGGSTVTVSGAVVVTGSSNIVLHSINNSAQVNNVWAGVGVTLNAGSVEVDAGSSINADGQGYVAGAGPGGAPGSSSAGGSYGGVGGVGDGVAAAAIYGSATAPTDLGSGGNVRCCSAVAGAGGGALHLTVSGTLSNNGIISANGGNTSNATPAGGGSGGSVYVTTAALVGSGVFTANGGNGGEAGGGGGRIAVYYNGTGSNFTGFAGSTASGGTCPNTCNSSGVGANGTSGFFDTSATNNNLSVYQNFVIPASTTVTYNSITSQTGALITIGGGSNVTVTNALTVSGTVVAQSINNIAQVNGSWAGSGVTLATGSVAINAGGSFNADSQGYVAGVGPGAGPGGSSAGGSYGGVGGVGDGVVAAATYGSPTAPADLGSGGNVRCCSATAGAGGGELTLTVSGTLTNNGILSANGGNTNGNPAGGGSGGALLIHTGTLAGSGSIAANGGGGGEAGGGGGRIALYYNTNTGFNLTQVTANGGTCPNTCSNGTSSVGGAGTVYLLGAGANLTVVNNTVLPPNSNLTYASITVNNAGTLTFGSNSSVTTTNLSVSAAGTMTVGGGSTVTANGPLTVTGNSNIILQSINNTGQVNGVWAGMGATLVAATAQIDAGSSVNADGQGYVAGSGPGAAGAGDSGGGSYGGKGGAGAANGTPAAATYGSSSSPSSLGSGGASRCCGAVAGAGGGAMRFIVSGTLTNNGIISANGGNVVGLQAGAGSGGSVFLVAGTLAGTGTIAANGGAGGEASGGGGRVALYYLNSGGFNLSSITAAGGTGGNAGVAGTVDTVNGPTTVFLQPTESVIHGTATVQYFTNIGGSNTLTLAGPQTATLATNSGDISTVSFDTTQFPDGSYQLLLTVMNAAGQQAQQISQSEVINNSVQWRSGTLTASQTWGPTPVQGLDGNVIVPAGVTLTIAPGTVVKALAGAQIIVQSGGTLIATGTTGLPVTFTTFDDSTIGGNTDFNQGISAPDPGEWNGIAVTGGTFTSNSNTIIRYALANLSGTLGANTTLFATQVYTVTGTLVVPSGVTLTIQPGSILKFNAGAGMDVQPGSTLTANGTLAQPIYFTSINDISIGGDTNNTNGSVMPAAGDWNSIILDGATVSLQHVQMQYGGGPLNSGNQAGMVETTDNANVTIADSTFAYSYAIGIQTGYPNGGGDTVTVTDSVFYGNEDRAINAYPGSTVHVVNDTIDGNAAGVFAHGGTVDVENSIVSNSLGTQFGGIQACCGGVFSLLSNNDVYTTSTGAGNYVGVSDPTGTLGNISANPVYMNAALHDYHPTYGSPAIDAANGTVAKYPLTDAFGVARYNDPLVVTKTGTADANGNFPDMGAFEFVQSAPSNIDLTVSNVQGPTTATVGTQATVTWTVTNIGTGTAYGPWHDAVYLVTDPNTNPVLALAGTALEGAGVVLGPGASYNATATIAVPGVTVGTHRWEVKTNVLGEIFEGANTANNTGIALNEVSTDLTQLVPGAAPVNGSFAGVGQSFYYKVVPSATQATSVQLALGSGLAGSVQLFVGAGYVPSPQRYDFQQVEYNSTSASVVIPSGSTQTYYVTAYAQTLPAAPAAFTIQASNVNFSLTSVTPGNAVASGNATFTFVGGGFTSGTTFILKAQTGGTYGGNPTFLADSDHADVTFNVGGIPPGTYTAEAINGSTVSLANAVTLTAPSLTATPLSGNVQITLEVPEAFRAGFPSVITLHYTNVSSDDIAAPLIYVNAANATLAEVPPPCSGCSSNYVLQYGNTFNSGTVLGINQQGPAGILPAGASGSIQFYATPTSTGSAYFYASADAADLIGTQLQFISQPEVCSAVQGQYGCPFFTYQSGGYTSASSFCSSLTPAGENVEGFSRACMLLLNNSGYTYTPTGNVTVSTGLQLFGPPSLLGTNVYAHVSSTGFNTMLANDATALSTSGIYTYDVQSLLTYEMNKDGLSQLITRYHQGTFGFGPSEPFDITLNGNQITYPDGTVRNFPAPSPTQANVSIGQVGDYGTLTQVTDGSHLLTETSGALLHFIGTAASGTTQVLDSIQFANGYKIQVAYTSNQVTNVSDSFGNMLTFQYDPLGHITQVSDASGRKATFTYTILNDQQHSTFLTSIANAAGTTTITWNQGGSSGVGYIDDTCVSSYCEPAISISSIAYPDGTHSYYTYDAVGRLVSQSKDGGAKAVTYTYNSNGSISLTDALGKTSMVTLNQHGAPLAAMDPLGNIERLRIDPENKLISFVGALGDSTLLSYDNNDNLNSIMLPANNYISLSYAGDGLPSSLTGSSGDQYTFGYDAGFDRTSFSNPAGEAIRYTYDTHGNVLTRTNRRGQTTTYTYNSSGLLATRTLSTGALTTYTYDNHQNLQTVTTAAGVTSYTYNAADQLTAVSNPDGTSLTYAYNSLGQRSSLTDSTGFTTNYTYDAAGRLSSLKNGSGSTLVTYTYDANGRLVTKAFANGTSTTYVYDANGNTTGVIHRSSSNAVLSEYDYTYDADNRPVTEQTPSGAMSYAYDLNGQLTSVTMPSGAVQYTYDANGNRTAVTTNGVASTYLPNNLNEYTQVNSSAYMYDADGNLLSGGGVTYTYDENNRLLTQTSATDSWSYQYDGLGNRVAYTHNGVTTHLLVDALGMGHVLADLSGNGTVQAHYVYGSDLIGSVQASGATSFYHFDGTGNTTQITNASGAVVDSYSYLPFGEKTTLASGVSNPFTYSGKNGVRDEGSGLYAMYQRVYNPALGRFQEQDPIDFKAGDTNLYRYANNSPVEFIDPLGLSALGDANNTVGQFLNYAGAFITTSGATLANNAYSLINTGQSLAQNIQNGNVLQSIHDSVLATTTIAQSGLAVNPEAAEALASTPPGAVLYLLLQIAPTLDQSSQDFFTGVFNGIYEVPPLVCGNCITHKTPPQPVPVNASIDPNGKLTSGYGNAGYVPAGAPLIYTVYFENQPTATLPAQKVTVTDPLPSNLDWSTVQFNQIAFNGVTINTPTTTQNYTTQATVSTDSNPVSVKAAVNPSTGVITWTMQSVDPVTGSSPANPLAGFLPPNNSANAGSGYVTFSVMPKAGLANGTTINNQASIVFDVNAAIATNTVTNTLDTSSVTSSINPLPATTTSTSINVSWTGSDTSGSGIASYNIYVAVDSGAYSLWLSGTTLTSSTYNALAGHTYSFTSLATNNVGIVQTTASTPQIVSVTYITPTVTVTPAAPTITLAQSLGVTITVANPVGGGSVPSGTVVLSSGSYTSTAATLSSGSASITVPAGALASGSDTLTATYAPDSAGSGTFASASGTAQVMVGGVTAPVASLSPGSLTFTAINGTTSPAQTVQFTNTGSATLSITGISLSGTGSATFAQTNTCGTSLASGGSCLISVTFTPSSPTSFSATLSIADNATGSPQTVNLTGTGTAAPAPVASVTPALLTFTSISATTSAAQTAQLSNTGNAALSITGISLSGAGAGTFAQTNTCGTSLAAGASCLISVTFTPSSPTSFSATLSIADNATGSPQTVNLTGTGTAAPAPVASVTPALLTFTSISGTTSAAQTAQLSNTGNAALSITGISLSGTGAGTFAQTNTCGTSLAAGASCLISVTFTPSSPTSFSATLSIADNATSSPQTVVLTGTGTAVPTPVASVTPALLTFTSISGTTSAAQTAQLSNTGNAALSITGISLSGTGASNFAQTNTCGTSLAAGGSCLISVTFTPTSPTSFSATLSIADNATGSPQTVNLSGTGSVPPTFQLSAAPASQVATEVGSVNYNVNVSAQGGAFTNAVTLTASGLPAGATASFNPASVTPGSTSANSTLTIQGIKPIANLRPFDLSSTRPFLALVGFLVLVRRKRRRLSLLCVFLLTSLAGLASLTGCVPAQRGVSYTITVTGTSGSQVQTTSVVLIASE